MIGCKECIQKHIGQVLVLWDECRDGHPEKGIYIVGHLAEIEHHLDNSDHRALVRELRRGFQRGDELDVGVLQAVIKERIDEETY